MIGTGKCRGELVSIERADDMLISRNEFKSRNLSKGNCEAKRESRRAEAVYRMRKHALGGNGPVCCSVCGDRPKSNASWWPCHSTTSNYMPDLREYKLFKFIGSWVYRSAFYKARRCLTKSPIFQSLLTSRILVGLQSLRMGGHFICFQ